MLDTIKFALPPTKERDIGIDYDLIGKGYYYNLKNKKYNNEYERKGTTTCRADVATYPVVTAAVPMNLQELYIAWLSFCTTLLHVPEEEVWIREHPDKDHFLVIYTPKHISPANIHNLQLIFVLLEKFGPHFIQLFFRMWRLAPSLTTAEHFAAASFLYCHQRQVEVDLMQGFSKDDVNSIPCSRFPFLGVTRSSVLFPRDTWYFRRKATGNEGSYYIPGISPCYFPVKIHNLNLESFTYYEIGLFSRMLLQVYGIQYMAHSLNKDIMPFGEATGSGTPIVFDSTMEMRKFITFYKDYLHQLPTEENKLLLECRYLFETI